MEITIKPRQIGFFLAYILCDFLTGIFVKPDRYKMIRAATCSVAALSILLLVYDL